MHHKFSAKVNISVDGKINLHELQEWLEGAVMLDWYEEDISHPDGVRVECVEIDWETLKQETK